MSGEKWYTERDAILIKRAGFVDALVAGQFATPDEATRRAMRFYPAPDPQPQADGEPTEQDVIGLQRAYTDEREWAASLRFTPAAEGSC